MYLSWFRPITREYAKYLRIIGHDYNHKLKLFFPYQRKSLFLLEKNKNKNCFFFYSSENDFDFFIFQIYLLARTKREHGEKDVNLLSETALRLRNQT